ncbi:MAG: hypothetical protein H0V60_09480 [Actinobacteria bacterium]|nr:hypothetical protein [Actinomycetota bacterium]
MSARAPTARLPRVLAGLQWAIVLAGLVFLLVVAPIAFPGLLVIGDIPVVASFCVFVLAFSTVGALVAARHRRNPIGWLMCAAAIAYTVGGVGGAYAEYAFGESSALLPGASVAAWLSTWVWGAGGGMPILVLVLSRLGPRPRDAGASWSG